MNSTYATEQFVKLFGALPVKREAPQPKQPPESSTMIPKLTSADGQVVYHVVPRRKDSRWNVKKEGGTKPSAVCDTKGQAIESARGFAQSQSWAKVVIHNKDGKVSQEFEYGQAPEPEPKPVGEWEREEIEETEEGKVQDY